MVELRGVRDWCGGPDSADAFNAVAFFADQACTLFEDGSGQQKPRQYQHDVDDRYRPHGHIEQTDADEHNCGARHVSGAHEEGVGRLLATYFARREVASHSTLRTVLLNE